MINYLIGAIFLIVSIFYLYIFGSAVLKNTNSLAKNVIVGYIIYSFCTALFLIPIQIFHLSWKLAFTSVIIILLTSTLYSFYILKKENLILFGGNGIIFFKSNYFLFILPVLLFLIYLLQFDLIWINNHLDDGYYLVKIATLPFLKDPYCTNYATGLLNEVGHFDSYLLSSYETKASIYRYLLFMDPVVFCRFALNILNYFLAGCTVYWFADVLVSKANLQISKNKIQYFPMVLLIFSFEYIALQKTGLLVVQDSWQFSSAMWYGSSIVRVMGILWMVTPFLDNDTISFKDLIYVFITSVTLISCSAIALPTIILSAISFLFAFSLTSKQKFYRILSIIVLFVCVLLGVILPDVEVRNQIVNGLFITNLKSILIIGCLIAVVVSNILVKKKIIFRISALLLVYFLFIAIPELNDFFENISLYDFVATRSQTTLIYTFIVFSFIMFFVICGGVLRNKFNFLLSFSVVFLVGTSILSTIPIYGNPINIYRIMHSNPQLIPNSTVKLSQTLNDLSKEQELNVLAPEWDVVDGNRHALSVMLRTYAPNIKIISAIGRFGVAKDNLFSSFKLEAQTISNAFIDNPNEDNYHAFFEIVQKYPITCVVLKDDNSNIYLKEMGFDFVSQAGKYSVYIKKLN